MPLCLLEVSLGQIDSDGGQAGPSLLEKVEKASGATANVEKSQVALIAPGEKLMKRRQHLSPGCIRCSLKKDFDLRIVSLCRLLRHPAARLKVEILEIIIGPLALCLRTQDFTILTDLAATMDFRQILEKEARAVQQDRQCAVMIFREGIYASFDVGQVLPEQTGHMRVELPAIGYRCVRMGPRPRAPRSASMRFLGELPHDHSVADVPRNARDLRQAISESRRERVRGICHAAFAPR